MQPIQDITDARKTYTLYECEKCGSLRLERSGKPITKCAYCDNLSLKQRFLSALISIVHEATYKIPNPNNTGIVQNKTDTKLPGSVVQVFVDNPKTYYTTKIQLGTTSIDYSYDCTSGDIGHSHRCEKLGSIRLGKCRPRYGMAYPTAGADMAQ